MPDKIKVKKRLIAVIGPTASGKSEYAVKLAKKINGEIISADSRQIYRGFDIGAGKVPGKWTSEGVFVYKGVPHHLIDEASPLRQYTVARFKKNAEKVINEIVARSHTPIICGGTGHWIDALIFNEALPEVKPDKKLRAKLSKLTTPELHKLLQKLDPARAKNIDAQNPRRLIRALEIVMTTGKPVPKAGKGLKKGSTKYTVEWVGLNPGPEVLAKKIKKRLNERLKAGMLAEVRKLHRDGLSWKRIESFGLEYKYCALFLQKKITREELETQLFTAIRQYAKRQMTWWKRNPQIKWQK